MCGRFVSATPPDELADYFGALMTAEGVAGSTSDYPEANYNVAPTTRVNMVRAADGHRHLRPARWGLVPFWAKDLKIGARMINARSETVADKPAFRRAYAKRRCLIPADGFYEWKKIPGSKTKQPYYIHRADGEPLVFGGLWERWSPTDEEAASGDQAAETIISCTILTCGPNATMAPIHDRMPVLVPNRTWDDWLDPQTDLNLIGSLLVPAPDDLLVTVPVSTEVNRVANNGPHLLTPVEPDGDSDDSLQPEVGS